MTTQSLQPARRGNGIVIKKCYHFTVRCCHPGITGSRRTLVVSIGNYLDTNQLTAGPLEQIWMVIDDNDRFDYWYGLSLNRSNRSA
jgi:hypothetical protein